MDTRVKRSSRRYWAGAGIGFSFARCSPPLPCIFLFHLYSACISPRILGIPLLLYPVYLASHFAADRSTVYHPVVSHCIQLYPYVSSSCVSSCI